MIDIQMYSLLDALTEVEGAYNRKESSVTLRNIHFACAKRVAEMCKTKVTVTCFVDHIKNLPCATFTFL